jgi:hypothetical protein
MNVDFTAATRDLDMSYNTLQDRFQELHFSREPPREEHRARRTEEQMQAIANAEKTVQLVKRPANPATDPSTTSA